MINGGWGGGGGEAVECPFKEGRGAEVNLLG